MRDPGHPSEGKNSSRNVRIALALSSHRGEQITFEDP